MIDSTDQLPDTANDKIGSLLAQAYAIETMTRAKRSLIESAIEAMKAADYVQAVVSDRNETLVPRACYVCSSS